MQLCRERLGRPRGGLNVEASRSMSEAQIHPTAIVDGTAEIGPGTTIGPYCIVGPGVVLGPDCWLQNHVTLAGPTTVGARNKFYSYCSIGQQTQDLKYGGEPTYLEI